MVYIILGQGFEELEAVAPCDILRRGGVSVSFAAVGDNEAVAGSHGITITADMLVRDVSLLVGDVLVIPGGMGGVNSIKADDDAMELISRAGKAGTLLAAICAGPSVLAGLGLLDGRDITCYPGSENLMGKANCKCENSVIAGDWLITGRAPGAAVDFGLALLERLRGRKASEKVRGELVY